MKKTNHTIKQQQTRPSQDMKFRVTSADFTKQTNKQKEKKIDQNKKRVLTGCLQYLSLDAQLSKYNLQTK